MHSEMETMQLTPGSEVRGKNDQIIGWRACCDTRILMREVGAYRGHSDVSGYGDDYRGEKNRVQVAGVNIVELQAPGIDKYVRCILRSAVLQCSADAGYVSEVAAHRLRIAELQRKEALQESVRQQILNRKKNSKA